MADNEQVKVVFRVSTSGLEADITLPTKITGQQLIQRVLQDNTMKIPNESDLNVDFNRNIPVDGDIGGADGRPKAFVV